MKPKQFKTKLSEKDIQNFSLAIKKNTLDSFYKLYISDYSRYGVSTSDDVLSLLLIAAISLKDKDSVKNILSKIKSVVSLTTTDYYGYSPISKALNSGDNELLQPIHNFLHDSKAISEKVECTNPERANFLKIFEYTQTEDFDIKKCVKEYLEPLYTVESLASLIGEIEDYL